MNVRQSTKLINIVYIILHISLVVAFIAKKEYFNGVGFLIILIIYLIFLFYEHKKGILITDFVRVSVLVSVFTNSFLGEYLRLYYTTTYVDKILHIYGTFSFSIFIFPLIEKKWNFQGMKTALVFIFVFLLGNFIGTIFEIGEFISDVLFKTVNQSNITDTNLDMIFNVLGAVLAGIFVVYSKNRMSIKWTYKK